MNNRTYIPTCFFVLCFCFSILSNAQSLSDLFGSTVLPLNERQAILTEMSKDTVQDVRCFILMHKDTPVSVIDQLAKQPDLYPCLLTNEKLANQYIDPILTYIRSTNKDQETSSIFHNIYIQEIPDRVVEELIATNNPSNFMRLAISPFTKTKYLDSIYKKLEGYSDLTLIDYLEANHALNNPRKYFEIRDSITSILYTKDYKKLTRKIIKEALAKGYDYEKDEETYRQHKYFYKYDNMLGEINQIKSNIINNPNLSEELLLTIVMAEKNWYFVEKIASNPASTDRILDIILQEKEDYYSQYIAARAYPSAHILNQLLTKYENNEIEEDAIIIMARNTTTPIEILEKLYNYKTYIRSLVAANCNINQQLYDKLLKDDNSYVLAGLAKNPLTTVETLDSLAHRKEAEIQKALAFNPITSTNALKQLANSKSTLVKILVSKHPNTTPEIVSFMNVEKEEDYRDEYLNYVYKDIWTSGGQIKINYPTTCGLSNQDYLSLQKTGYIELPDLKKELKKIDSSNEFPILKDYTNKLQNDQVKQYLYSDNQLSKLLALYWLTMPSEYYDLRSTTELLYLLIALSQTEDK
ncbi:MAG: hypothetical protein LBE34_06020 [Flavobacteriaceae bacterium]|jgi:hypothetical protein|nr:hypothetical protein [Flavobacteriaceae bacterium]